MWLGWRLPLNPANPTPQADQLDSTLSRLAQVTMQRDKLEGLCRTLMQQVKGGRRGSQGTDVAVQDARSVEDERAGAATAGCLSADDEARVASLQLDGCTGGHCPHVDDDGPHAKAARTGQKQHVMVGPEGRDVTGRGGNSLRVDGQHTAPEVPPVAAGDSLTVDAGDCLASHDCAVTEQYISEVDVNEVGDRNPEPQQHPVL